MSTHFSHPECLPYSGTQTVYFIMGNCVYAFQSPRVSSLFRDTDCLLYSGKLCLCISVTWSVFIIQGHGLSTLLWDKDCLHCSGTWSPKEDKIVYLVMSQRVSALLWHLSSLLRHSVFLSMSIGLVYLGMSSVFLSTGTRLTV